MQENIPSTRNLIDTDMGPLRRFIGILASMPTEPYTSGEGTENQYSGVRNLINVADIEVIETVEPYHLPIYTIRIGASNRKKSRW